MMKKLAALFLALVMVLSVSAVAMATEIGDLAGDGIVGNFTNADEESFRGTSVYLYKEITAYNPENCTVNAPTITYEYTITAGSAGKDIYDSKTAHNPQASAHALTKAGIGSPAIQGTVDGGTTWNNNTLVFTPAVQLTASSTGTANKNNFKLKVDFSDVDFATAGPGVYRYVINETTTETTKNAAGIKEGTGANTLYLDVYVNGSGTIYGYVCFTNNNSIDAQEGATSNTVADAGKVEGFVDTDTSADTSTADEYFTFNLEIKKTVENDTYTQSNHHQFPFHVKVDNPSVTAQVLPIMTVGSYATQTALSAFTIGTGTTATEWTPTIGDEGIITYVGIPCGTTVTIYEENDVLGTTYAASVKNADATVETKNIYYDGTTKEASNTATVNCGETALQTATENHTSSKAVEFTNKLLEISPTGVVLRIAPYALILGAGIALLLISRRRKAKAEEE